MLNLDGAPLSESDYEEDIHAELTEILRDKEIFEEEDWYFRPEYYK